MWLKDPDNPLIQSLRPGDNIRILDGFLGSLVVVVVIHEHVQVEEGRHGVHVGKVGAISDVGICPTAVSTPVIFFSFIILRTSAINHG